HCQAMLRTRPNDEVRKLPASTCRTISPTGPKVGCKVPLDDWFRGGLGDMALHLLTGPSSFVGTTFDPAVVDCSIRGPARRPRGGVTGRPSSRPAIEPRSIVRPVIGRRVVEPPTDPSRASPVCAKSGITSRKPRLELAERSEH